MWQPIAATCYLLSYRSIANYPSKWVSELAAVGIWHCPQHYEGFGPSYLLHALMRLDFRQQNVQIYKKNPSQKFSRSRKHMGLLLTFLSQRLAFFLSKISRSLVTSRLPAAVFWLAIRNGNCFLLSRFVFRTLKPSSPYWNYKLVNVYSRWLLKTRLL